MSILAQISANKIIAIIRGAHPADVIHIAQALHDGGIKLLEITMNSAEPLAVIEQVANKLGDKMTIGAGTILDTDMARQAARAGAKFMLSPIVDQAVIQAAEELGMTCIPGAYTATEIYQAYQAGAAIVKVFPATSPAYLRDIAGPLPHIPLLPTGGVTLENIGDFKKAGAVGFGIGSALVNTKHQVTDQYLLELTKKARQFVQAVNE